MSFNKSLNQNSNHLEEMENSAERLRRMTLERRREAFHFIARAIPDAGSRLCPFYDEDSTEIDWRKLLQADWTDDEIITLQWLRSMWEGKMYVEPRKYWGLFPMSGEMTGAIFCALGASSYAAHMIDRYWLEKYRGDHQTATGQEALSAG